MTGEAAGPRAQQPPPEPDPAADVAGEMSLADHLRELRTRLIRALIGLALGAAVGYMLFPYVFDVLLAPYCDIDSALRQGEACAVVAFRPLEPFSVRIKVSLVVGLIVGGPVIFYQLWRFITPALLDRERRYALPFVLLSQLMFVAGVAFAYVILPLALDVLLQMAGEAIQPLLSATEYVSFLLTTAVAFGVLFEIPLVLAFLALAGVVSSDQLRRFRAHAILGNFLLAAVITPTTDPITMTVLAVPMALLYEATIWTARIIERRRRRRRRAET